MTKLAILLPSATPDPADTQNRNNLKGSNIPVLINTLTQTYYVFALRNKRPQTYQSKLTNVIAITFAGM